MGSSRSEVKYREGYGPSDNYSHELDVSPDLALEELLEVRSGRGRIRKVSPSGNRQSIGREALRFSSTASSS